MAKNKDARHVRLYHFMLKHPSWRTLSSDARSIFIHVCERYNGTNNGQIVYAVREGQKIGVSKNKTARALHELIERGFLRIKRGAAFTHKTKEAREWILTNEPFADRPATREFMHGTAPQLLRTVRAFQYHQRDRQPLK
jgi:DNA-binding transcriptional regulator YhcF (GntR family)